MISQLSAKYQFGAIHTADITDGKITNRAFCLPNPRKSIVYTRPDRSINVFNSKCLHVAAFEQYRDTATASA